jgi:hypothetical protein
VFTPRQSNAGVATTTSTTPEHRAVNDGFHIENSADLQAILVAQTVLLSTAASAVTDKKIAATLTVNLTD